MKAGGDGYKYKGYGAGGADYRYEAGGYRAGGRIRVRGWWRLQQVQRFGAGGHGYKYKGYGVGGDHYRYCTKLEDIKLVVAYAYGASWWRFQQVQRFGAGGHGYKYKGY